MVSSNLLAILSLQVLYRIKDTRFDYIDRRQSSHTKKVLIPFCCRIASTWFAHSREHGDERIHERLTEFRGRDFWGLRGVSATAFTDEAIRNVVRDVHLVHVWQRSLLRACAHHYTQTRTHYTCTHVRIIRAHSNGFISFDGITALRSFAHNMSIEKS